MADEVLEIRKMTIDEVKQNPPALNRKFILINSSLYTDEAFEYVLELINETDSIAFIRDTKKIYTHGEYFGGDLWEDTLFYFGNFQILSENDEAKITLEAEEQKETLRLKGINNLDIYAEEEYVNGEKLKTIIFNYDVSNVVNTSVFTIDDNTAQFNLEIKDGQINVNKYVPMRVELGAEIPTLEYDSNVSELSIPINVYGTDSLKNLYVTSSNGDNVYYDEATSSIKIPNISRKDVDTDILIVYGDSKNQGSLTISQKFSFACIYGLTEPDATSFNSFERYIPSKSCNGEISLTIDRRSFGWFACPDIYNPIFIDKESNIGGGWILSNKKNFYSNGIMYNVYRTENRGLGDTKWIIKNFE